MFSMFGYFPPNITKKNNDTRNASTDRLVLPSLTSITVSKFLIFLFNEDKLRTFSQESMAKRKNFGVFPINGLK